MKRQADWLSDLRTHLFRKANLRDRGMILDIGCGSGIIANELFERSQNKVVGVDINLERIEKLTLMYPDIEFICADATKLPFSNESFDLVVTSWFWVWMKEPALLAAEIKRVLKKGGVYISLAEMDSGAVIEYPLEMEQKKRFFIDYITRNDGDPFIARKIKSFFTEDNLNVKWGAFTQPFDDEKMKEDFHLDWSEIQTLNTDYFTEEMMNELYCIEIASIENKTRFQFRPVFWHYVVKVD